MDNDDLAVLMIGAAAVCAVCSAASYLLPTETNAQVRTRSIVGTTAAVSGAVALITASAVLLSSEV
jgi:hypothetical protein